MIFAYGRDSSWSLVAGRWSLVRAGFWLLASGFWLLASGLSFPVPAAQASIDLTPYLDQPVANVVIRYGGAPLTGEDAAIADLIGIRPGDRLRLPVMREVIIRLYQSGYASNVVVTAEGLPTAMTLKFDITPQPVVNQVLFEGVSAELADESRRRLPPLDPSTRVTKGLLDRAAENLVEYYHSLGYFNAQVIPDIALESGGRQASVIFRVTPGQQFTVAPIQLDGSLKTDPQEVLSSFQLQPGVPYNASVLQEDVERLRRFQLERGYLAPHIGSPRLQVNREEATVTITIPVDSGPLVDLRVEGVKLSDKHKQKIFPTLEAGGIDPATLEEGRLKLLDHLQRQGHFFAEVHLEPVQQTDDQATVVFQVDPGRKYDLQEIRIEGTEAISYESLKSDLGSRPGGFFSRGLTSRELMEVDQRVITDSLRARGYLDARVEEGRLSVALNREDLIIIYVIAPGPLSQIAEILFKGNAAFSDQELQQQITSTSGEPLSQPQLGEDAARLTTYYSSRGYAESTVDAKIEFLQPDAPDVRVVFNIYEGPQLTIHRVLVRGNTITQGESLKRFLAFQEGQLLVNERLADSEQDLYATGAFRRILINKESAGIGPEELHQRNISIEVVEAPRYLMSYGGGYRTDDGPRGLFEITNTNFLGRLYTGSFRVRASRRQQLGQVSFTNPRPLGYRWPTLLSTFYQREERDPFDASRLTGLIQVERELPRNSFLILRYSFSNVIISDVTEPDQLRREDTTARIGRVSGSFLWDRRDSAFDATRGQYTTFDLSLASRYLGGNENFIRLFAEHQRYYQIPGVRSTVFATDARIGLAKPFGRSDTIPISERFFAGGSTTLRGFSFENAGPRGLIPNKPGQTQPLGGNALIILNAELRFPIWQRLGLGGALFYDTGNVFGRISDIKLKDFTHTVGFGFRIKTPVGPIRIDFGVLVKEEPLVPRSRFHFSFGPPF